MKKSILSLSKYALIIIFYSCQPTDSSESGKELEKLQYNHKVIEVNAKIIKPVEFSREILSNGILNAHKKAKLVFKVNENIAKVYVKNGQAVKQGEILVELDNFNQQLALEKAKNNLLKAEIELKDILFAHSPGLADTSEISPKVMETARGRSGYNDALVAVKEAGHNLSQTLIKAPFNGVVSDMQVKENNYSGSYEYFAYIADISKMEVEFGIMESELAMVSKDLGIIISPYAFPDKKFKGVINEINPVVDQSGMIKVKALVINSEGILLDGMNAEVVVRNTVKNQLVVPKEAVLLRQERNMLFTLKNDSIAQWVYVKTGLENTSEFTIVEGISTGDIVIVSNNFNLGHDVIVKANIIK